MQQVSHSRFSPPDPYPLQLEALAVKKFGSVAALAAELQLRRERRCVHAEGANTADASAAGTASTFRDMETQHWPSKQVGTCPCMVCRCAVVATSVAQTAGEGLQSSVR